MDIKKTIPIELLKQFDKILTEKYRKTGKKHCIEFRGSKGYLSHIALTWEGEEKGEREFFTNNEITNIKS